MAQDLKIVAIIPARMGSTRFPGKPIADILGLPMIEHVRRRVERVQTLSEVLVATCDREIVDVVEKHGGKAVMTADTHERCTDRIEEAAREIQADVVINVQGDEPLLAAAAIEAVVEPFFSREDVQMTNVVAPIHDLEELSSLNVVKTVLSRSGRMLYLSRSPLPGNAVDPEVTYYKQTGIIGFRKEYLHAYSRMEQTPLEQKESCDVLRILENDQWIQGVVCDHTSIGVDIPEQIAQVEELIRSNPEELKIFEEIS